MTLTQIAIFAACTVLASVTQSVSGFGFGVVLVGLLPALGIKILDVVILVGILVVPNIAVGLWTLRRHVSIRRVVWILVGIPLGVPVGIYLQLSGPEALVHGLLGAVLIFAAIEPFFREGDGPRPTRPLYAVGTGAISGILGAAFSTGGPPVVIYYYRRHWTKEVTRATLLLAFAGSVTMRMVPYACLGKITPELLLVGAAFCPVVVAASLLGERVFRRVSQEGFRRVIAAMLLVLGVYQIGKAFSLW